MRRLSLTIVFLGFLVQLWGQPPYSWEVQESTPGKPNRLLTYTWVQEDGSAAGTLTCSKENRTMSTAIDPSGNAIRWVRSDKATGRRLEIVRSGKEFKVLGETPSASQEGQDLPWYQDISQLGNFARGTAQGTKFVGFADLMDNRLKASDMTVFRATREARESVSLPSGTVEAWKIHVTFDDVRSVFWGADYWFRVTDGRLVRFQEVRGGPGTPVTTGTLLQEDRG